MSPTILALIPAMSHQPPSSTASQTHISPPSLTTSFSRFHTIPHVLYLSPNKTSSQSHSHFNVSLNPSSSKKPTRIEWVRPAKNDRLLLESTKPPGRHLLNPCCLEELEEPTYSPNGQKCGIWVPVLMALRSAWSLDLLQILTARRPL